MKIHTMPQRSEEWYAIRCGKFTASDFDTLMPSSRQKITEFNKTQMGIIYRVAAERMTGSPIADGYVSQAMQHGIDTEAEARAAFELEPHCASAQPGDAVAHHRHDAQTRARSQLAAFNQEKPKVCS